MPLPRFLADDIVAAVAGKAPHDLVFEGTRGGVRRNRHFGRRTFLFPDQLDDVADRLDAIRGPVADSVRTTEIVIPLPRRAAGL